MKSGSSVAAMGLDGARYRKPFGTFCGLVEEIKSPCDNRGLAGLGCSRAGGESSAQVAFSSILHKEPRSSSAESPTSDAFQLLFRNL